MPRGGRRTGSPGASYSNRTDLQKPTSQPMQVASGQQYGARAEQMAAQRAMPLAGATAVPPPAAPAGPGASSPVPGPAGPPMIPPGSVVPLDAPSTRPNEPITAGLSVGAGAGVEANPFSAYGGEDDAKLALRQAYAVYPSEDLRAILERMDLDGA